MGCQPSRCPNCKTSTRACKLVKATDGKQCCTSCVKSYNEKSK